MAGRPGTPLRLSAWGAEGNQSQVEWPGPLESPQKYPLTREVLAEQLGRLGDTPFELADIECDLPEAVMVPKSVLNDLRRRAVAELLRARASRLRTRRVQAGVLDEMRAAMPQRPAQSSSGPSALYVLARTLEQLDAVLAWRSPQTQSPPAMVYCDFEDLRRYRDAVARAKAAGVPIGLATLRIIKPGEAGLLRLIAHYRADALLIRNLAALMFFREHAAATPLIGDYSLNAANELTAQLLLEQGIQRLVPSYDLNWEQFSAMMGRMDASKCEVVIHQHMPMFHMEHCVFAHLLSNGKDHRDCGRPCDAHRVDLRDRVGSAFPLLADTGCRNTVFNSVAQSAAEYVSRMQALGIRHFRVELLRESGAEVGPLLDRYARVLAGQEDGRSTWRQLQVLNQIGVTRGTLKSEG
jgi:putative protease